MSSPNLPLPEGTIIDLPNTWDLYSSYDTFFEENNLDPGFFKINFIPCNADLKGWRIINSGYGSARNELIYVLRKVIKEDYIRDILLEGDALENTEYTYTIYVTTLPTHKSQPEVEVSPIMYEDL